MIKYVNPTPYLDIRKSILPNEVKIYDRTLRGIVQTLGNEIPKDLQVELVNYLALANVDVIEIGIPFLSEEDTETCKYVVQQAKCHRTQLSALARTNPDDVKKAYEIGVSRVYTFMATSEFHIKHMLKSTPQEVLKKSVSTVKLIKELGMECEFTLRDAMNSDVEFVKMMIEALQKAGVDVINIADTVGICTPRTAYSFIKQLTTMTNVPISVHFHDDFGLATANVLAAVEAGAKQIHTACLGLSERSGMAPTEEVGVALRELYNVNTNLDLSKLLETVKFISGYYNIPIPDNKSIIGKNSFLYEVGPYIHSGDHEDDIIQFEPFSPEIIGRDRHNKAKGF